MPDFDKRLRTALQELVDIADMVENSTDRAHWQRLDRAIAAARRLLEEDGFERRSRLIAEGLDIQERRRGRVR